MIFGFSLPVLTFMKVRWPILAMGAASYTVCLIDLQKLLTRTAFVGGTLASAIVFILVMFKEGGHLTRKRRGIVIAVIAGMSLIAAAALLTIPEFEIIRDRILESGEDSRQILWEEAWDNILRKPWGGGTYGMVTGGWAHNIILDFALYHGFFGCIVMTSVLCVAWFRCWQLSRRTVAMDSPFTVLMSTILIAISIVQMISPPYYPLVLFIYIFIGYSTSWLDEEKRDQALLNPEAGRAAAGQAFNRDPQLMRGGRTPSTDLMPSTQ